MEQFSIEKYVKNPFLKVITRNGLKVEILKVNAKGSHPIIGTYPITDQEDMEISWRSDGRKIGEEDSIFDLFFADDNSETDKKIANAIYQSIDFLTLKTFGISEDEVVKWLSEKS